MEPSTATTSSSIIPITPKTFSIKWDLRSGMVLDSIRKLMSSKSLTDVVLSCSSGKETVRCHKLMLAASSYYFEELFTNSKLFVEAPTSVVVLKDVHFSELLKILEFIYEGEAVIDEDKMAGFLSAASSLRIKGLVHNDEDKAFKEKDNVAVSIMPNEDKNPRNTGEETPPALARSGRTVAKRKKKSVPLESSKPKPKFNEKHSYKNYTQKQVLEALEAIEAGMSCSMASKEYGIPRRTIYLYKDSKKKHKDEVHTEKQEVLSELCTPENNEITNNNVRLDEDEDLDLEVARAFAPKSRLIRPTALKGYPVDPLI